jgi:hypothetical protein
MKTRGFVVTVALVCWVVGGLLVSGVVYEYGKLISPGRNTKTADKLATVTQTTQQQAAAADAQAQAVKAAVADVEAKHAAVEKTQADMAASATGFIAGSTAALQSDPKPTPAETVSLGLNDDASKALGSTLTPAQAATWNKLVAGLLANNAAAQAQVEALKAQSATEAASLAGAQQHAADSDAQVTQLSTALATQTKTLTATATIAAKLGASNKSWADDAETLWQRIEALGWLSVFLVALAIFIGIKFFGVKTTLTDATALVEYVKGEAVKAGHDAVSLEQKIHTWWDSSKNENKVASIKKDVLRL